VKVTIPRFSLSHDTLRPADNAKYLKPLINATDHSNMTPRGMHNPTDRSHGDLDTTNRRS
jgi:hypothetical protein